MKSFEYNKLIEVLQIINEEESAKNILEISCSRESDYIYLEFLTIESAKKFYYKCLGILNMEHNLYIVKVEYKMLRKINE